MPRKSVISSVPVIRRIGRHVIGVSDSHFKRISKLRKTNAGMLSVSAVAATAMELGLKQLEESGGIEVNG